jgi:4-hydroxybenzoate polyprenyltransferase
MSRIKWFVKTLAYGFAVFIGISAVFGALYGWRADPTPLLLIIVFAVAFIGYRFYERYSDRRAGH